MARIFPTPENGAESEEVPRVMDCGLSGEKELEVLDEQIECPASSISDEMLSKTEESENFSAMPSRLHR